MSKELNIIEAIKMPVGTEFKVLYKNATNDDCNVCIDKRGYSKVLCWTDCGTIAGLNENILNAKFIPIQQSISFMEAVDSLKRIKVIYGKYDINTEYFNVGQLINKLNWHLHGSDYKLREVIKEGRWYTEE